MHFHIKFKYVLKFFNAFTSSSFSKQIVKQPSKMASIENVFVYSDRDGRSDLKSD